MQAANHRTQGISLFLRNPTRCVLLLCTLLSGCGTTGGNDDTDPCAIDNGGCGDALYFICTNNEGAEPTCTDIDECANNNGGCGDALYFTCTNNEGASPLCTGFDECETNNGACGDPLYYRCTNNNGSNPTCTDIDECQTNNGGCGDALYVICNDNDGADPTCTDIDECLVENGGCGDETYSSCINNEGADPTCIDLCAADECGNGVIGLCEECDDGNLDSFDGCLADCTVAECGDGALRTVGELVSGCPEGDEPYLITPLVVTHFQVPDPIACATTFESDPPSLHLIEGGEDEFSPGFEIAREIFTLKFDVAHLSTAESAILSLAVASNGGTAPASLQVYQLDGDPPLVEDACDTIAPSTLAASIHQPSTFFYSIGELFEWDVTAALRVALEAGRQHVAYRFEIDASAISTDINFDMRSPQLLVDDGLCTIGVEVCDDGNTTSGDGCDDTCNVEYCSDGIINNVDETCDDGNVAVEVCDFGLMSCFVCDESCHQTNGATSYCGDGMLEPAYEGCDSGPGNADIADTCRTDCELPACGDGIVDSSEECDDGAANDDDLVGGCRTDCLHYYACGDGVLNEGEECDDGAANSNTAPDACRANCKLPRCGDAVTDTAEDCDDANGVPWDSCGNDCSASTVDLFTTPGTFNWQAPAGVTSVHVQLIAGGGGGGGGASIKRAGTMCVTGGGGGGAPGRCSLSVPVTPGQTYQVIVGEAGSGGAPNASGSIGRGAIGGTSRFGTLVSASGGSGGLGGAYPDNGGGGTGGICTTNSSGSGDNGNTGNGLCVGYYTGSACFSGAAGGRDRPGFGPYSGVRGGHGGTANHRQCGALATQPGSIGTSGFVLLDW